MTKYIERTFDPPVHYAPPITEHVSLHVKSIFKHIARVSGGCNNNKHAVSWGEGATRKDPPCLSGRGTSYKSFTTELEIEFLPRKKNNFLRFNAVAEHIQANVHFLF